MKKTLVRAFVALMAVVMLCLPSFGGVAFADTNASDQGENTAIVDGDSVFGLQDFQRMQTGSSKTYNGVDYGYVYLTGKGSASKGKVVVLGTNDEILVYLAADVAESAGLDSSNPDDLARLEAMIEQLDVAQSKGGKVLSELNLPYVFTDQRVYELDGATVSFAEELEDGYYYACVKAEGAETSKGFTQFCDAFTLLPADQVAVVEKATGIAALGEFLGGVDMRPLWVSIKTALVAMIFIFILGLIAAWRSMHVKSRWKSLLDSVFTIPMVLPPTVCGFILLVIFGKSSGFGRFLIDHGISLVFTWPAAVIAAVVVGFPLMYRTVLGAFEALDINMLDAARTLGWSERKIFSKLMLPLAWPSIAAGTVLAFARAMGEFGATLFFAGNYAGVTQTMPIAIYFSWMGGATNVAVFWVIVVIAISFLVILFINLYSSHVQKYRRQSTMGVDEDLDAEIELGLEPKLSFEGEKEEKR